MLEGQPWECGVAALAIILAHYGSHVPLDELRRVTGVSRDGLNGVQLRDAARRYGLDLHAVRLETNQLETLGFPCIAHVRFIHFVVVEGIAGGRVFLNDQGSGPYDVAIEEFDDDFTGLAFAVRRLPEFVGRPPAASLATLLARHLAPARRPLIAALGSAVVESAALLAAAVAIGRWVSLSATGFRWPLLVVLFMAIAFGAWWLRACQLRRAGTRLAAHHTARLVGRLSELPAAYFTLRLPRFVAQRVLAGREIGDLIRPVADAICRLACVPVLAIGIAWVPAPIGQLAVIGAAWSIALWWWLYARRRSLWRRQRHVSEHARLGAADRLATIESNRLAGRDADSVAALAGTHAQLATTSQEFGRREAVVRWARLSGAVVCLFAVLIWPSGPLRHDPGGFTTSLLLALALWLAADALLRNGPHLSDLVERVLQLDEFYGHEADDRFTDPAHSAPGEAGRVVVRGVTFGYSTTRPPILAGLDFEVPAGGHLAITGPAGSGRTTLARIVAGVLRPWTGTVSVPNPCLLVDAHSPVFPGSIRDNVTLWDSSLDEAQVAAALEDACLGEWVRSRPGGIDAPIELDGTDMSGGERRRLALARALVRGPRVLVLDELLDGLEDQLTTMIRSNLARRGCTLIIVSCREPLLDGCDVVIELPGPAVRRPAPADRGSRPVVNLRPSTSPVCTSDGLEDCPADILAALADAERALGGDGRFVPSRLSYAASADPLRAAASACGLYLRRVRPLSAGWWLRDHGVMVARSDGATLALLPLRGGGYRAVPGGGARGRRVTAQLGERLRGHLFAVYRQPLSPSWSLARGLLEALRSTRVDAEAAVVFLVAAWALTLVLACRLAAGSASAFAVRLAIGVIPAILACLFVEQRARLRLCGAGGAVLQAALWSRLMRVSIPWLRGGGAAGAVSEVETVEAVTRSLVDRLGGTYGAGGVALGTLSFIAALDHRAATACGLVFAAACAGPLLCQRGSRSTRRAIHDGWQRSETLLLRWVEHVSSIRFLGAHQAVARRWIDEVERLEAMRRRAAAWSNLGLDLCPSLAVVGMLAAFFAGSFLEPAALARLALFATIGSLAVSIAVQSENAAALLEPRAHRLAALFAAPLEATRGTRYLPLVAGSLSASNVAFGYPGATQPVLSELTLRIDPGELVAITGCSGTGKTTLLRLMVGFERPTTGRIEVGGLDLATADPDAVRRSIDMVMQDEPLEAGTIRWHIAGMSPHGLDTVWEAARLAGLDEDIRAMPMGMETLAMPDTLSASQVCGIQIARALLRRPAILILDEATAGLSLAGHARLFDHLRAMGTTVIFVSHRQDVLALADRVIVLRRDSAPAGTAGAWAQVVAP